MGSRRPPRYPLLYDGVSTRDVTDQSDSAEALFRLGLRPGASERAIRRAFRALSRVHHPDVNPHPSATEQMRAINLAYRRALAAAEGSPRESPPNSRACRWTPPRAGPARRSPSIAVHEDSSVTGTAVHFGFIDRDQTAVRSLEISARSESIATHIRVGADWIHVSPERLTGTAAIRITADPRMLSGFWDGRTRESAMIESWIDLVQKYGITRVIVRAILRRQAGDVRGRSS